MFHVYPLVNLRYQKTNTFSPSVRMTWPHNQYSLRAPPVSSRSLFRPIAIPTQVTYWIFCWELCSGNSVRLASLSFFVTVSFQWKLACVALKRLSILSFPDIGGFGRILSSMVFFPIKPFSDLSITLWSVLSKASKSNLCATNSVPLLDSKKTVSARRCWQRVRSIFKVNSQPKHRSCVSKYSK